MFLKEFESLGVAMRLLKSGRNNAAIARNSAVRVSTGEIVAMIDQDVILPRDWLRQIDLTMGPTVAGLHGTVVTDFNRFIEPLNSTAINAKYLTACAAYRRDVLFEVGLFSEDFPFFRGDSDLAYKIIEQGYKIVESSNVVVYHPLRRFEWSQLKGISKWSTYDALLCKRFPKLASEDVLKQVVPRFTPEGLSFVAYVGAVIVSTVVSPVLGAIVSGTLIIVAIGSLAAVRSTLKGKPLVVRVEAASLSLVVYLAIVLGRLAGVAKYHHFIL